MSGEVFQWKVAGKGDVPHYRRQNHQQMTERPELKVREPSAEAVSDSFCSHAPSDADRSCANEQIFASKHSEATVPESSGEQMSATMPQQLGG
jgi:hypothetical protein